MALPSVTVLSDETMSNAIIIMARNYSQKTNVVVNTSFTTPEVQQQQILEGGAGDIVITPMEPWIEELKTRGLVDVYSKTEIAKNRLALVTSRDNTLTAELIAGFPTAEILRAMDGEQAFILAHPQTQIEGTYAKQALRDMGVASDLEPYTLYIKRSDEMMKMAERPDSFGVFFHTTVKNNDKLRVIDFFPENSYDPIRYYAVVIAGDNMNEARKFLNYLTSKEARRILISNGFIVN